MSVKKQSRFARRTSASIRRSKKIPVIIGIIVFVVIVTVAAVITGNFLKKKADSYTPEDTRYNVPESLPHFNDNEAKSVLAYAYRLGSDASANAENGVTDFSACLRYSDHSLSYSSEVCRFMGFDTMKEDVNLSENTEHIHSLGGYFCGYMYMDAFNGYPESQTRIKKAYEISLAREAAENGVDDILLLGIEVDENNIDDVAQFISEIKNGLTDIQVGILIDCQTMQKTFDGIYLAGKLIKVCDYIALDLRGIQSASADGENTRDGGENQTAESQKSALEQTLEQMDYFIKSYNLRLVFGSEDSENCQKAIELGYGNCQMVVD